MTLHGHAQIPLKFEVLANWIAEEVERNRPETIKTYITALHSHHIDNGLSTEVLEDPRIARMLRGALRIQGAQPIRERSEITKGILEAIATIFKPTYDELNLRTAFCVAFAAFLRPSEFTWEPWDANKHTTHMTRESVQFTTLPKSKTDQFRTNPLAFSGDSTCPVKALQPCKIATRSIPKLKSEPLFF